MAISDTKLRTIYGKPYSGPQEVADADGLSVRISPKGVIQFQYRYRWHGKPNRLGLGRYPSLSLKDARQITADLRNRRVLNERRAKVIKSLSPDFSQESIGGWGV